MLYADSGMTRRPWGDWVAELAPFDAWNERALMIAFGVFGIPKTLLDVGCGTGAMVNLARKLGVDALGVDQIGPLHHEDWIRQHDLREPLNLAQYFQLVLSIETGEHIEPEHDQTFIETVASHVDGGGLLIFTAAHPGQAGNGHVNCSPATYWRTKFSDQGLNWNQKLGMRLALAWSQVPSPAFWLPANVQVFNR